MFREIISANMILPLPMHLLIIARKLLAINLLRLLDFTFKFFSNLLAGEVDMEPFQLAFVLCPLPCLILAEFGEVQWMAVERCKAPCEQVARSGDGAVKAWLFSSVAAVCYGLCCFVHCHLSD